MELQEFFKQNQKCAIAFSGGVDSVYLLYAAVHCGADVKAYYVRSPFQPAFELEDAKAIVRQLNAKLEILELDVLDCPEIVSNTTDRCYHCKMKIFSAIQHAAAEDGYTTLLDGTNASDDTSDRPGMKAIAQLHVRSPLRECGLTKETIRRLSKDAGLFTWNKPAYACLATRIPTGTAITREMLENTEAAEDYLHRLGFSDFRVRYFHGAAKLQIRDTDLPLLLKHREEIREALQQHYQGVFLDLEVRK